MMHMYQYWTSTPVNNYTEHFSFSIFPCETFWCHSYLWSRPVIGTGTDRRLNKTLFEWSEWRPDQNPQRWYMIKVKVINIRLSEYKMFCARTGTLDLLAVIYFRTDKNHNRCGVCKKAINDTIWKCWKWEIQYMKKQLHKNNIHNTTYMLLYV